MASRRPVTIVRVPPGAFVQAAASGRPDGRVTTSTPCRVSVGSATCTADSSSPRPAPTSTTRVQPVRRASSAMARPRLPPDDDACAAVRKWAPGPSGLR